MSVLLETTEGDIIIDLHVEQAPKLCNNFLKLCKAKYYNFSPFFNIQRDFSCQNGDPLYPLGDGGSSVWGLINNDGRGAERRFFVPDKDSSNQQRLKHSKIGTVSMPLIFNSANGEMVAGSQFIITLADNLDDQLHKTAAVFGQVVEGFDTLEIINKCFCDDKGRPYKDIRIKHTYILEDPLEDIEGLEFPPNSPEPSEKQLSTVRLSEITEYPKEEETEESLDAKKRDQEARAQALILEIIGDLPHAEVKPEENVLFVCKLNPVTKDEDLELIFSRFGNIISCEIVRDFETGNSLQYGFIEFENQADCEKAYMKMEGVLIDDNRIHVDFSQSVSKLSGAWRNKANSQRERKHGNKFMRNDKKSYTRERSTSPRRNGDKYSGEMHNPRENRTPHTDDRRHNHDKQRYSSRSERRDYDSERSERKRDDDRYRESDRSDRRRESDRSDRYRESDRSDRYRESGKSDGYHEKDRSDRRRESDRSDRYRESDRSDRYRESDKSERYRETDRSDRRRESGRSDRYRESDR